MGQLNPAVLPWMVLYVGLAIVFCLLVLLAGRALIVGLSAAIASIPMTLGVVRGTLCMALFFGAVWIFNSALGALFGLPVIGAVTVFWTAVLVASAFIVLEAAYRGFATMLK